MADIVSGQWPRQSLNHQKLRRIQLQVVKDDAVYPGMRKLKLKGRDLEYLPNELFTMTDIEVLDLSPEREACLFYRLAQLPPAIARLANLRVLMLDTNELTELTKEVCRLPCLERLSLSNNNLMALPSEFSGLSSLRSLHLSNNDFDQIPDQVYELKDLEFLDVCDNKVSEISSSIAGLKKLHSLLLFLNKLTALPDQLCDLVQLKTLWIGGNRIAKLPRNFGKLKQLDWGRPGHHTVSAVLNGNPLEDPPPEVCCRGVQAVSEYFASRRPAAVRKK